MKKSTWDIFPQKKRDFVAAVAMVFDASLKLTNEQLIVGANFLFIVCVCSSNEYNSWIEIKFTINFVPNINGILHTIFFLVFFLILFRLSIAMSEYYIDFGIVTDNWLVWLIGF